MESQRVRHDRVTNTQTEIHTYEKLDLTCCNQDLVQSKKERKTGIRNSKSLNRNNNNNNFNNREKGREKKKKKPRANNKANQNIKVIINVFLGFLCLCCAPQPVSVFLVFWRRTKSDPMLETVSLMFFSDLFFIVVVIIIIHNGLPPRTLPLCLLH